MNELNALIDLLIKEKGGTKEQYLSLMNKIAHHESKGDSTIKQIGGGPGRGLFQFEEGEFAGAKTAANRTIQYYNQLKKPLPKWLKETQGNKSIDASKLTPEQQHVLFLGNMRKHPKANFTNVWKGNETVEDFWVKYHWAGKKKDEFNRRKSFQNSSKHYVDSDLKQSSIKIPPISSSLQGYSQETNFQNNTKFNIDSELNIKQQDATYINLVKINKPIINEQPNLNLDQFDLKNPGLDNKQASLTNFANNYNVAALGGNLNSTLSNMQLSGEFNSFNGGGTHEENPNGGIPQGMGNNGKMNTVEEDETSYNFKDKGKYIFSNRIKLDGSGFEQNTQGMAMGGYKESNCGGPGQPPCKDLKVDSKDHPRYQAYQDSLSLYNYNKMQRSIEKENDTPGILDRFKYSDKELKERIDKRAQVNKKLFEEADKITKLSPNIRFGMYRGQQRAKEINVRAKEKERISNDVSIDEQQRNRYKAGNSSDIYSPNIAPEGTWQGYAMNEDYSNVKPNQKVVVNENLQEKSIETKPTPPKEVNNYTAKVGKRWYIPDSKAHKKALEESKKSTTKPIVKEVIKKPAPKKETVKKPLVKKIVLKKDNYGDEKTVKYWEVELQVNQNFGSHKTKKKVHSRKELDMLLKKQAVDEKTKTGKKNKLIIKQIKK